MACRRLVEITYFQVCRRCTGSQCFDQGLLCIALLDPSYAGVENSPVVEHLVEAGGTLNSGPAILGCHIDELWAPGWMSITCFLWPRCKQSWHLLLQNESDSPVSSAHLLHGFCASIPQPYIFSPVSVCTQTNGQKGSVMPCSRRLSL